jgi:hypothetical protein
MSHRNISRVKIALLSLLLGTIELLTPVRSAEADKPSAPPKADARFALLVGIDDYAQPQDQRYRITPLKGPGNDVALMKDLLVKQFGFQDDGTHIVTLVGSKATHQAIIDAVDQQLVNNAKQSPGSTVVFYFSGHGSQAYDTGGITGSGFHQTLVAYDSRREGGTDILDDEFNRHLEALRQHTDRITLIFDSCHSGSVWKDVTTMTSKSLPPNPFSRSLGPTSQIRSKDVGSTIKPNGGDYSVIVASTADESAVEDQVPTKEGRKYHGLLTFYLDKIVRESPTLTYDQAAKRAATAIAARAPSQHPQAEGDIDRLFLAGSGNREQPYVHVLRAVDPKKFQIDAGRADGLQAGAILAVYGKDVRDPSGDVGKIGNARAIEVDDFMSVAELSDQSSSPVTTDSKVRIVTPFAPAMGMKVFIPSVTSGSEPSLRQAIDFLSRLRQRLTENQLLSIADDPQSAKVVVRWNCKGDKPSGELAQPTNIKCPSGYQFYLSPPDQPYKLFDLTIDADGDVEKLAHAVEARARQENLRGLENLTSKIEGQAPGTAPLSVRIEKLTVTKSSEGVPTIVAAQQVADQGITGVKVGEYFRFVIKNDSSQSLYVAVVWIGSGGSIGLYSPTNTGELILPSTTLTTRPPLEAGPPEGLETYKVIATTKPGVNFRVLEQPGLTRAAVTSPLEWLLNQTGNTQTRDPHPAAALDLGDWTTAQHDIFVLK